MELLKKLFFILCISAMIFLIVEKPYQHDYNTYSSSILPPEDSILIEKMDALDHEWVNHKKKLRAFVFDVYHDLKYRFRENVQ